MEQPVPSHLKHSRRQGKFFSKTDWEPTVGPPEVLSPTPGPSSGPWAQPRQQHIPHSRVFPEPIRRRATEPVDGQATSDSYVRRTIAKLRRSTSIAFFKSSKSQTEDVPAAVTSENEESPETPSTGVSSVFDTLQSSEDPTTSTSSAFSFEECVESPTVDEYSALLAAELPKRASQRPASTIFFTCRLIDDGEFELMDADVPLPVVGMKPYCE